MTKKILVTGGAGFVGSHVSEYCAKKVPSTILAGGGEYEFSTQTITSAGRSDRKASAAGQTRTDDNLVNSQVLYLLSYGGRVKT